MPHRDVDVGGDLERAAALPVQARQEGAIVAFGFSGDVLKACHHFSALRSAFCGACNDALARRLAPRVHDRSLLIQDRAQLTHREVRRLQNHLAQSCFQNGHTLRWSKLALQDDAREHSDHFRWGNVERRAGGNRSS